MPQRSPTGYASRGGDKLAAALDRFGLSASGLVCADLGSHVGGFVDCLLRHGARRIHSVDTSYGTLAWRLRKDPRVVVLERTNAMHVELLEPVDLVTIDVGWTRQAKVLPNAVRMVQGHGTVVSLIKPHYEAETDHLQNGVLPRDLVDGVVANVVRQIEGIGLLVVDACPSPLPGHAGNREVFLHLRIGD